MKFFTPELYLDLNSRDMDRVEKAHEKWDDAIGRYREHLKNISPRMAPNVRKLALSLSLHDSSYDGMQVIPSSPKNTTLGIVSVRQNASPIALIYLLAKRPSEEATNGWPFSTKAIYWLFDEFDVQADGLYLHEVLLSDGRVLRLSFFDAVMLDLRLHKLLRKAMESEPSSGK